MEEKYSTGNQDLQNAKKGVLQAEAARKESYGTALTMMEHRHVSQQTERDRLAKKYGENSDRVVAMDRRLAGNSVIGKATKAQQSRTQNAVSDPPAGEWKMVGRVVTDTGKALPGLTVSLFGENGWERVLGHTCTDDQGYYTLQVTDYEIVAKYDCQKFLPTVTDENKEILYQEHEPVTIEQGKTAVRHIIIGSSKCSAPGDSYGIWNDSSSDLKGN